jgi:dTDP-4-amino-4,6-dideoxygalactose transaminase
MHLQPVFDISGLPVQAISSGNGKTRYPARVVGGAVSEDLFNRGLCLPSGTAMQTSDLDRVISVIRNCYKRK